MSWGFDGAHGTDVRPAHKESVWPWAKDPSLPTANDGTRLTASLINRLVGNIRALAARFGSGVTETGDDDLGDAIVAAIGATDPKPHTHDDRYYTEAEADALLDGKVDTGATLTALADGGGFVRMTDAERTKLAALSDNYRGAHASLAALQTAHPTGAAGEWAVLTHGAGSDATFAVWDSDEASPGWIDTHLTPPTSIAWGSVSGKPATFAPSAHTHPVADLSDASANARSLLQAADYAAMRTLLSLTTTLKSDATATLSKGFTYTPHSLGNMTSFTVDPAEGNLQYGTNNAAITITAPAADCSVDILVTNHATTAGTITFSGFTAPTGGGGDTYATTGNNKYLLMIRRINSVATYAWKALQ